ncbi:cell wall metabolism sensor histidine kinase WalK [Ornithinibacillus halophilus]|uniref:histidine kinase n=1 Tax=Ornithinibacillus halophilus TaxID=930117 RepID=A0A1M5G0K2_9BACI|nr:cell wall metabolism sensor histidine kinase WalK [Ornithinibacillus halophilus]SHF97295.1 PAS/PAC sensor signal transduction histidine kinase [Ornithinibacillus halophilus]
MHKIGFFRSIQLKFIIIYILLLLVAVQLIGSYVASVLEEELTGNFTSSIDDRVDVLTYYLGEAFSKDRSDENSPSLVDDVQGIVRDIDTTNTWSLLVVDSQSRVLATNDHNMDDNVGKKTTLDTVQRALLTGTEQPDTLYDLENGTRIYVNAVPLLNENNNPVGVIYFESSLEEVYNQLENINDIFLRGSILAIVISAILGIFVARAITKPIKEMRRQALTMAKGDFTQKVNIYGQDEIGQLAETFNDLNDRLKHSYATIEEERRKLSSVLSNMSDGVIATDLTGAVTLMNEAAGKLISQDPEVSQGKQLLDVLHLDEKVVDISELQDSGSMIIDFSDEEQIFLLRANFSTVTDDEEDITGFITVLSDVTEQEKLEQERREFVSNVSHELRTPLTTMRSYMEALTDGAWENKEIAPKFMGVVQNETERMIRMVNDLLQLSRMDNKDYRLQKERMDFIEFFHHIIDRFEMNVPEGFQFNRDLPNQSYYVSIDVDKMTQVLDNVISNAIKYSPNGGTITFRVSKQRYQLLISVEDQGMGVAYDKLDKIFDRFYRADKARTRKFGGTGLGLAISKELVEAHHGRIWASSKEGKGTTINITLPLMGMKRRNRS